MAVRNRGESLTWGILILTLGIVFLIGNFRPEWHVWRNIWKFWPVLLIVMGVNKLLRYFSADSSAGAGPPR